MMVLGDAIQLLHRAGLLVKQPSLPLSSAISLVTDSSKECVKGALFLCKGASFRVSYLEEAINRGAVCYVSETAYSQVLAPFILVTDIRAAMGLLAAEFYENPSHRLSLVGITGTKGKTTAAYLLRSILTAAWGVSPAFLSTIETYNGVETTASKLTTPEPLVVQKTLREALDNGCRYGVMEVSSQALKYGRVAHTRFAAGVYLNIGEDHVGPGEHDDWEDYFSAKLRLFDQCAVGCVNLDGPMSERALLAAQKCPRVLTYSASVERADVYASRVRKRLNGLAFHVRTPRFEAEITLQMAGLFNVSNALAAIAAAEALGLPMDAVVEGLATVQVPGRMETYGTEDLAVLVDYAHNPMALEAVIASARQEYPGRPLTVVFGCPGGKGLSRRAPMGELAGRLADRVILTEDDPAKEDPAAICAEIAAASEKPCDIIVDRGLAVETAILEAPRPAVVIVAGKGAETVQKRPGGDEPFPGDAALVRQALGKLKEVPHRG